MGIRVTDHYHMVQAFVADNLPFFVFLVVFFAINYSMTRGKRRVLRELASKFHGTVKYSFFMPTMDGAYEGLKFRITLIPQGKSSPPYLVVSLYKRVPFRISISRENFWTRFVARMGWAQEVEIHDPLFDREFSITSDKPGRVLQYLGKEDIKAAIRDLFASGFSSLKCDGKTVRARKPNYRFPQDLEIAAVGDLLKKMALFTRAL